jgi:hypothetical protein
MEYYVSVAIIADLDGDGKCLLVVAYSDVVTVWRSTIPFQVRCPVSQQNYFSTGSFPSAMEIADLDLDSKLDMAIYEQIRIQFQSCVILFSNGSMLGGSCS